MTTVDGVYHIGFLLDDKVSLDGARGDAKFFTDTHRIGSGELRGESGEHLFGLRGSGGGLAFVVAVEDVADEAGEVVGGGTSSEKWSAMKRVMVGAYRSPFMRAAAR